MSSRILGSTLGLLKKVQTDPKWQAGFLVLSGAGSMVSAAVTIIFFPPAGVFGLVLTVGFPLVSGFGMTVVGIGLLINQVLKHHKSLRPFIIKALAVAIPILGTLVTIAIFSIILSMGGTALAFCIPAMIIPLVTLYLTANHTVPALAMKSSDFRYLKY